MDNLCCHKMIIVNSGPLCLASGESVDHLLLRCKVAYNIWMSVIGWFGLSWGFPYSLLEHFQSWKWPTGSAKGKLLWWPSVLVILWTI